MENTVDIHEFMKMIHKENVLFAVIDYLYGLENVGNGLNVVDVRTIGRDVFLKLREEDKEIPVYILDGSRGHVYTEKEKNTLMKRGVGGFIESKYFKSQLEETDRNVCCQVVMETLTARHQILTYGTRKEFDEKTSVGSIIFCDFRLETAVESEDKPVFVMAATNLGNKIDFALQRRFDRSFEMDCLDRKGRRWVLEKLIKKQGDMFEVSDEEIESIVDRSARMSPAVLERVVEAALREGIRSDRMIDDDLFDEIFEKCTLGAERVGSSLEKTERTAYHEAGHALMDLYYGRPPAYMSIVARGNYGGYMLPAAERGDSTREYYLEKICSALGGRAAETVFEYGLTAGAAGDLEMATEIAAVMVCKYGMYEKEIGLAVIGEKELPYNEQAKELVNRILSEQMKEAVRIIEANQDAMKRLVNAVMKNGKKYLTEKEILEAAGELNRLQKTA